MQPASDASASILAHARAGRADAPDRLAPIALGAIGDAGLRAEMVRNPRLQAALAARLVDGGALALPDSLPTFESDAALLHLLDLPRPALVRALGLGWFADDLSAAMIGGRAMPAELTPKEVRAALRLRDIAPTVETTGALGPDVAAADTEGRLCLAAWCGSLPDTPAMIAMELGLFDTTTLRNVGAEARAHRIARRIWVSDWIARTMDREGEA
ncbi:hypothetical protein GCM10011415_37650 [Salipiger pallidus]|uniref:Uncharacterized protein n=1 Tax=Salipiger pallidus TaxID=1775170 RepID=A0A8J2ZNJ8_9RHOB|nr:hypothetical protein [Salipiger pallidus]GGG84073.1 hypothetical protein GCM10011415_37650 [Salipiger pallidus]